MEKSDSTEKQRQEGKEESCTPRATVERGILEDYYGVAILMSLLKNGRQKKTALLKSISKSSCISKHVDILEDAGLIFINIDRFEKNTKWVNLTSKGVKVTEVLFDLDKVLEEK